MQKINLGQEIIISEVIKRREHYVTTEMGTRQRIKTWDIFPLKKSKKGIVIGIRTLSNGRTSYQSDYGYIYYPNNYFKALLVVSGIHAKPFFVKYPQQ